jgi:hypothetical protein
MVRRDKSVTKNVSSSVLHQNVQSISNKQTKLDLVLKLILKNIEVLYFTEYWVKEDYLNLIQIDQYKLVSYFSRKKYDHRGSCIYEKRPSGPRILNVLRELVWRRILKCL